MERLICGEATGVCEFRTKSKTSCGASVMSHSHKIKPEAETHNNKLVV